MGDNRAPRGNGATPPRSPGTRTFRLLPNEPRIVTEEIIEKLEESGASSDYIAAAKRAARTNPVGR